MNRLLGLAVVLLWLVAFTSLVVRDVLPYWRTQDPPHGRQPDGDAQVGIFDADGRRIGTAWISTHSQLDIATRQATTLLTDLGPLQSLLSISNLLIDSSFMFSLPDGQLLTFDLDLRHAPDAAIEVSGQLIGQDYACTVRFANLVRDFSFDAGLSHTLGESLRPFSHLPNLRVGQSWRIQVIDHLALLRDRLASFTPQLVRVTRRETIRHDGWPIDCFRIETDGAVAWADDSGRVLLQRVDLPLLGTWELRDEPFDLDARQRARRSFLPPGKADRPAHGVR